MARLEVPVARLPTDTWLSLPVAVVNGRRPGPRLWLTAAVHGDELNGVEIIRTVLDRLNPRELSGAVLTVPIVNVFGFVSESRYLPDRRDLNRSFPGSSRGSLAGRLANLVMTEVVAQCSYGIDLHTGSDHRYNLPQIRADLEDEETLRFARAFAPPVLIHARTRDGSLREAATAAGCHVLLFEAGEANRFDAEAIEVGVDGVLGVLDALGMWDHTDERAGHVRMELERTTWVRARRSGIMRLEVKSGDMVERSDELGVIADAFGQSSQKIRAPVSGVVIGYTRHPLVSQGDALVHIGEQPNGVIRRRRVAAAPFSRQR